MIRGENRELLASTLRSILPAVLLAGVLASIAGPALGLSSTYLLKALVVAGAGAVLILATATAHHPHAQFGAANCVTIIRATLVALLAGLIGEAQSDVVQVVATLIATIAAVLDAVDGRLARRAGMTSRFGARLDMETDALLILVLAILVWQSHKAAAWVLLSGLLRYAFVSAGATLHWMRRPLPPSRRRQCVAVIQIVGLILAYAPWIPRPWSDAAAALALGALLASFAVDVVWLARNAAGPPAALGYEVRWIGLLVALLLLNGALTFHNVWPTLLIRWPGELSVELAALVLLLAMLAAWRPGSPRLLLPVLAVFWVLFTLGRYGEVTAPALYGREVNLYWDIQHVTALAGMLTRVMSEWVVALGFALLAALLALLYIGARWSLARVSDCLRARVPRYALGGTAALCIACFLLQRLDDSVPRIPQFSIPVSSTYAKQLGRVAATFAARRGLRSLPASPSMDANLSAIAGADVLLVFLESYGRITYDRPELARHLGRSRADLTQALRETGRDVASAFFESPTFGGSSWFAHLSLLSGIEVRDPDRYELLMTLPRPTLITSLRGHGYRSVALMPGLRKAWPEGSFYGFDAIYGAAELDYRGPEFGWWRIPDQYTLARLDANERTSQHRAPLFVFFPTVNTHMPFRPTPPYQPDWQRLLGANPYDAQQQRDALLQTPAWNDMGASYAGAVAYTFETLAGYLREHAHHELVMIVLGDHQPPANVSGAGASWDVPVHVITSNPQVQQSLVAQGFAAGLTPSPATAGRMHELAPQLMAAFSATVPAESYNQSLGSRPDYSAASGLRQAPAGIGVGVNE